MAAPRRDRLGPLEVVGAWLGLWTPPRDAVVPPVPWRAIVPAAVVLLAALAAAAVFVLPGVADDREAARLAQQRAEAERRADFLASVDREQRPRRGRGRPDPGRGAPAARRTAARGALMTAAESGIALDARGRSDKPVRGVDCEPFPRSPGRPRPVADLARPAAAFDCVAVTSRFGSRSAPGGRGVIGMPFRLVVHFDRGRFAWCRIVPLSDRDRLSRLLPSACRLRPR